jgi:hypothetical protein
MGEPEDLHAGPGWLGLGWLGSGVIGGAAVAVALGGVLGGLASRLSDTSPDDAAVHEMPVVVGAVLGAGVLLPVGILLGFALGAVLRSEARRRPLTPAFCALTGVVLGGLLVPALAVSLGVIADPAARPGLPALPVLFPSAAAVAVTAGGLALLMRRSATRLGAWPS